MVRRAPPVAGLRKRPFEPMLGPVAASLSSEELALRTIERAKDALRSGRAVGLPELVKLIQTLSSNPLGVDVSTLAEIIQKDPVILANVFGAAQKLAYNVSGAHVTSLAQAIHLVGFGRIRTLTMTLLIADAAGSRPASEEHRQAAAAAVCSGFVAESLAQELRLCDREEAFIGACLRNLGHVVMTAFMLDDYRAALAAGAADSGAGWRAVFGLTPLELGRELLQREHVPEEAMRALEDFRPGQGDGAGADGGAVMLVCEFATRIAEIGLRSGTDSDASARAMETEAARFAPAIPELAGRLDGVLAAAGGQLREFMRDRRISSLPETTVIRFTRRTEAFCRRARPNGAAAEGSPAPGGAAAPEMPDVDRGADCWNVARERLQALVGRPGATMPRVLANAVEMLRSGFEAAEVLVFSGRGPRGEALLTGGSGEWFLGLPAEVAAHPADRTVLGVCLKYRENVLIQDADDPKIAPHLPDWLKALDAPSCFALFPLVGRSNLCGVVLVGWRQPRRLALAPEPAAALARFLHTLGGYCEAAG